MLLEINWDVPAIVGTAIGCLLVACGFIIGLMFLLGYVTFRNSFARPKTKTPEEHPLHSVLCPNSSAYAEKLAEAMKELEKQPVFDARSFAYPQAAVRAVFPRYYISIFISCQVKRKPAEAFCFEKKFNAAPSHGA